MGLECLGENREELFIRIVASHCTCVTKVVLQIVYFFSLVASKLLCFHALGKSNVMVNLEGLVNRHNGNRKWIVLCSNGNCWGGFFNPHGKYR